ncbi:MAG: hypothetical protein EAZ43_13895 [Betaproteobacteria bacterium]|nr:MAG: hypothetical protein EAZ43_13895 [Betaproteobacteria bacterium]
MHQIKLTSTARVIHRIGQVARAALLACITALSATATAQTPTLPPGFSSSLVALVSQPTAIAFLPDGRMLITSQTGGVFLWNPLTATVTPSIALAINTGNPISGDTRPLVCSTSEGGMLGVAVDPDFSNNNYIYLFYTARNGASSCANVSYGTTTYSAVGQRANRVSRFTFNTTTNVINPAETVLINGMPARGGNHNAGDLHFGRDGFLYVSIGDGGQDWSSAANRGGGAGSNIASRDKNVLTGKILRVTRDGDIPASNPFQGAGTGRCNLTGTHSGSDHCQETYAWGLRNPFRFAMDPNAAGTRFFINDVGQGAKEEIDESSAGADYGWPCREGSVGNGAVTCNPTPPNMIGPYFDYGRSANQGVALGSCTSITGGAFVPGGVWPASYSGKFLFADYVCGGVFSINGNTPGGLGPGSSSNMAATFASSLGNSSATSLRFGPNGPNGQALYYTSYVGSSDGVYKIVYNDPVPNITSPSAGAEFSVGQNITFTGSAVDGSGNSIPASALSWEVVKFHDTHTHPVIGPVSGASVNFTGPEPEDFDATNNTYLQITLTATDGSGRSASVSRIMQPKKVTLQLRTVPLGLKVRVNNQPFTTSTTSNLTAWADWQLNVNAPPQNLGTSGYRFANWSDGGAIAHTYTVPNNVTSTQLAATYTAGAFVPNLDADNNGAIDAVTDGILITRYLMGFRGAALTSGNVVGANAERSDPNAIASFLDGIINQLNIDAVGGAGSGGAKATTDGLLIMRYLLGLSDAPLINGVRATGSTQSATDVLNTLNGLLP